MPRKSRTDVIKERFGGKWSYKFGVSTWNCTDGRQIVRVKNCNCWLFNDGKCNCPITYEMRGDGKPPHIVDIDDPRIYEFNGKTSVKKSLRKT